MSAARGLRLGLPLLLAATIALASMPELPVRNLGFESWGDGGKPEGWWVGPAQGYRASADCGMAPEGRCALKLESLPDARLSFLPLGQVFPSAAVGGHLLKLSGMIRTEKVEGWAGLWMRVDAPTKPSLRLENMHRFGPRGTNDWQRFEVQLPVAPNASQVAFGVLLHGSGTAWFDDLKLVVDESVSVEKADLPELAIPPRPEESQAHLDDAALALPEPQIPRVRDDVRDDVRKRHHPIRSLFSDDFSDLAFLKPLIAGKRVVMLGESAHGVAEFNWLKVRLAKFLHREMGFDVIAFESSLSGCRLADSRIGNAAPREVMRDCIFQVWHTAETLRLFEYLEAERKAGRRLTLAGFDVQNSGAAAGAVGEGLVAHARRVDPALARVIERHERRAGWGVDPAEGEEIAAAYRALAEKLASSSARADAEEALAIQELRSRAKFVMQRTIPPGDRRSTRIRDEGMADNLDFVLDKLHPGRKVIVWAHNFHIAREQREVEEPLVMGEFVHKRRGSEVYAIGLYMGRGVAASNSRQRYGIAAPPEGTLEAILAAAGRRMGFVDFSRVAEASGPRWMFEPIVARSWGTNRMVIVPARTYDAVIYVDTVTPPEYR